MESSSSSLNNAPDKPVFIISLDTELAWGFILHPQHATLALLQSEPQRARGVVDLLLRLFEKYDIPATWAVVGHLFLDSEEREETIHPELPQFKEGWLDWDYYCRIRSLPLYYGKDLVEKILASSVRHEIGLHSLFHIPFSQCSQEVAGAEVELGVKLAQKLGITPSFFVFPGNQVGHVEVLKSNGFHIYRGGNAGRWDETQSFPIRHMNRAADMILPLPLLPLWKDGIWEIPISMPFSQLRYHFSLLPRVKLGIERAIRQGKVFHVCLHPHDLLLGKSIASDLESLLAFVAKKRDEGKLLALAVADFVSMLSAPEGVNQC